MIKSSRLRRDWTEARQKVSREGRCRICGSSELLQAAHTISRRLQDVEVEGPRDGTYLLVKADAVIPLCQDHHYLYDQRLIDILPHLHLHEQTYAVETAGGIVSAYKRLTGERP